MNDEIVCSKPLNKNDYNACCVFFFTDVHKTRIAAKRLARRKRMAREYKRSPKA